MRHTFWGKVGDLTTSFFEPSTMFDKKLEDKSEVQTRQLESRLDDSKQQYFAKINQHFKSLDGRIVDIKKIFIITSLS